MNKNETLEFSTKIYWRSKWGWTQNGSITIPVQKYIKLAKSGKGTPNEVNETRNGPERSRGYQSWSVRESSSSALVAKWSRIHNPADRGAVIWHEILAEVEGGTDSTQLKAWLRRTQGPNNDQDWKPRVPDLFSNTPVESRKALDAFH